MPPFHVLVPETLGFLEVWVLIVMTEFAAILACVVLPLAFHPGLAAALATSSAAIPVSLLCELPHDLIGPLTTQTLQFLYSFS